MINFQHPMFVLCFIEYGIFKVIEKGIGRGNNILRSQSNLKQWAQSETFSSQLKFKNGMSR